MTADTPEDGSPPSVTTHLEVMLDGDPAAAQFLWSRYFPKMVEHARGHLRGLQRAMSDEEDIALLAFQNFYEAATAGRVPDLNDRNDLWRALMVFTFAKAVELRRYEGRQKRGGGNTPAGGDHLLAAVAGPEADPAFAAMVGEQCRHLLGQLPDPQSRRIAVLKMEGRTNEEIAAALGVSARTVRRQLALIRKTWEDQTPS